MPRAVRAKSRRVSRRGRRPKVSAFKGFRNLFTTNINSYEVPVFQTRGLISGDAVGFHDAEAMEIAVQLPGPGPAAEADRMLHEHLHAISSIVLPPDKRLDENQVNSVSLALVDMFIRNPSLWAFLSQRISQAAGLDHPGAGDGSSDTVVETDADPGTTLEPTHTTLRPDSE